MYATDLNGKIYGYNPQRMIVRAPGEHTIDGLQHDLEIQIEMTLLEGFTGATRTKAMLSLLFLKSDKTTQIEILSLLASPGEFNSSLNNSIGGILPSPLVYFAYEGSETMPDCNETVNWYVVTSPIPALESQIEKFNAYWKSNPAFAGGNGNNREIQNMNNRLVKKGGVECEEQFIYFFSFVLLYAFINYFIFKLL